MPEADMVPTCPHCSGYSPTDAPWCTQCYQPLSARPAGPAAHDMRHGHAYQPREHVDISAPAAALGTLAPVQPRPVFDGSGPPTAERHPGWRPPADDTPAPPTNPHRFQEAAQWSTILVLVAIGAGAAANWLSGRIARGGDTTSNDLINDGLALTVLVYVVVGLLILLFKRFTGAQLRWHEGDPLKSIGAGVFRGALIAGAVTAVVTQSTGRLQGDTRFTALLSENNGVRILVTILLLVVAAPLVEETLFRGLLLESWRRYALFSLLLSGFAFASWHLNGSAIIYYWLMGIALGRIYVRRGLIGSMAAHATFNAIVLGVTIASISGSGHDYAVGALHVHTPPTWHTLKTANPSGLSGQLDGQLVLAGPSGSSIAIVALNHRKHLTDQEAATETNQLIKTTLARTGSALSQPEPTDLPLGPGEHVTISDGTHSGDIYVMTTADHSYLLAIDAASSKTATNQIPGILSSLREN